jgi:hypothetical protein
MVNDTIQYLQMLSDQRDQWPHFPASGVPVRSQPQFTSRALDTSRCFSSFDLPPNQPDAPFFQQYIHDSRWSSSGDSIAAQHDLILNGVVEGHHKINTITLGSD